MRYQVELRKRLRSATGKPSRRAEALGKEALEEGLETLDLAHIHGEALFSLMPGFSNGKRAAAIQRAGKFFLEVLSPIEKTRRAMLTGAADLKRSNESLLLRTTDLTASNRLLKKEIVHRNAAERSLRFSEKKNRGLLTASRQFQLRLRHLSHQVLLAQEAERKEISRELRDEIVQTLTGINVQLASLKIEAGISKESFFKHIRYTQRLVEKSVDIVHQFARDLRPTLLDDLGLIPALHAYLKAFTRRTGLQVGFTTFAGVEKLSNAKRTVLYRVAQAALTNISQHARANLVNLAIRSLPQAVIMEIKDDGKSFDAGQFLDSGKNGCLGLIGMRERVEMVGGIFAVDSAPGRGTQISATLPFKQIGNN